MKSKYLTIAVLLLLSVGLYAFIGQENVPEEVTQIDTTKDIPLIEEEAFRSMQSEEPTIDNTTVKNSSLTVPRATDVSWHIRQ